MKSVLISIQPKWCELIASGKKTVEVRKTRPKIEAPFKVYIYMTKAYDTLFGNGKPKKLCVDGGKVIGEFVCDCIQSCCDYEIVSGCSETEWEQISRTTQLSRTDLLRYSGDGLIYFWHISDLVIYDKPKDLDCFRKPIDCHRGIQKYDCVGCWDCEIKRPPQSWCYVEEVQP